jgi:hypothetical protein
MEVVILKFIFNRALPGSTSKTRGAGGVPYPLCLLPPHAHLAMMQPTGAVAHLTWAGNATKPTRYCVAPKALVSFL